LEVAQQLVAHVRSGANIALAGGSTPREAYLEAAGMGADWTETTIWFGDERCVPPDHPESNFKMVFEAFSTELAEHELPRFMRIQGELDPEIAAAEYETELRADFGNSPEMDLIILGLGEDGHTASLFPGKPAVKEMKRFAVEVPEAGMDPQVPRVSMTFPLINAAREVTFLIKGEGKAKAVRRAFDDRSDESVPASLVRPTSHNLIAFVDEAAASELLKVHP
jgi:6-phosphogluconolactonase